MGLSFKPLTLISRIVSKEIKETIEETKKETIKETIDYIIHKIYTEKVIEPMCKKSIFKKLLINLTKECAFSINN